MDRGQDCYTNISTDASDGTICIEHHLEIESYNRKTAYWTEYESRLLIELHDKLKTSMAKLADAYNKEKPSDCYPRKSQALHRQLVKLGESRRRNCLQCDRVFISACHTCSQSCTMTYWQSNWEPAALEYLVGIANTDRPTELGLKFNKQANLKGWRTRSHNAIIVKLFRTGQTAETISDHWTASDLARHLNIIRHRVYKWIKTGKLSATNAKARKGGKSYLTRISAIEFRRFCRDSPHLLQGISLDAIAVLYGADRADLKFVLSAIANAKNDRGLAIEIMKVSTLEIFRSVKFAAKKFGITESQIHLALDKPGKSIDGSEWVTIQRKCKSFRVEYWQG
jgi:hypothetical protein